MSKSNVASPTYHGKRHYDKDGNPLGGIKVLVDGATIVEVETGEQKLCEESYNSPEILEFKQKTNKEVVDYIHNEFSCKFEQGKASSGDFILCRLVVNDTAKHDRKGTVRQILDEMQGEKSCRVSFGDKTMKQGGEISEAELHKRWAKKKNQVQHLSKKIQSLRYNLTRDLKSDDEKVFLTALVVATMERTFERVGNSDSEDNGHFGVTGFLKKHCAISGNTIIFTYVGKSGVSHEKQFSDEAIADALRKAIKNSPSKFIFCTTDGFRIKSDKVNRYLKEFGIRSKDLRGYGANRLAIDALNKLEVIEKDEKKRKKQFGKVLKYVAKKVGHGTSTLRKHYLMPEVESRFVEKKKILDLSKFFKEGGKMELPKSALPKTKPTLDEYLKSKNVGDINDLPKDVDSWSDKELKKFPITTAYLEYKKEHGVAEKKETDGELSRRTVVGCFIYAQDTDEYLFLQRCTFSGDNRGKWHILSGCGNEGESTDDTARREIKEEVGYDGEFAHFEMIEKISFPDYDFYYYAVTVPKKFKAVLDWENKDKVWVKSIADFHNYDLIPEFKKYLNELVPAEKKETGGVVVEHYSRPQTLIEQLVNLSF